MGQFETGYQISGRSRRSGKASPSIGFRSQGMDQQVGLLPHAGFEGLLGCGRCLQAEEKHAVGLPGGIQGTFYKKGRQLRAVAGQYRAADPISGVVGHAFVLPPELLGRLHLLGFQGFMTRAQFAFWLRW